VDDERLEVGQVEVFGALCLWEDEVEEEEEAQPRVKGHPAYDEQSPGLSQEGKSEHDEVDEPWCRLGRVTEAE